MNIEMVQKFTSVHTTHLYLMTMIHCYFHKQELFITGNLTPWEKLDPSNFIGQLDHKDIPDLFRLHPIILFIGILLFGFFSKI